MCDDSNSDPGLWAQRGKALQALAEVAEVIDALGHPELLKRVDRARFYILTEGIREEWDPARVQEYMDLAEAIRCSRHHPGLRVVKGSKEPEDVSS